MGGPPPGINLTPIGGPSAPPPGVALSPVPQGVTLSPVTPPPPALMPALHDLSANPRGEGTYKMVGNGGTPLDVPYSNVQHAAQSGYNFADQSDRARYAEDYMADPSTTHGVIDRLTSLPLDIQVGAAKALLRSLSGMAALGSGKKGPLAAINEGPGTLNAAAENFENRPNKNAGETIGDVAENVGEYFTGDELLSMVGKAVKGAEAFKGATQLAQVMEKYPAVARLARIGLNAAKQAAIGGGQTLIHTGGDVGAAGTSAAENAAVGAVLGGAGELARGAIEGQMPEIRDVNGTKIPVPKGEEGPSPAQVQGAKAYGDVARAAVSPHLAAMGAPPEFIENTLNSMHDFTGAADRLGEVNQRAYDFLDRATSGRFRRLNVEVQQAQQAAYDGVSGADKLYNQKLGEMENLLSTVKSGRPDVTVTANRPAPPGTELMKEGSLARQGEPARTGGTKTTTSSPGMTPEDLQAIKQSWRQFYVLKDMGRTLDQSLDGVPGASAISQEQRGINGGRLMSGLKKIVNRYGRANVEASLGPGRLGNLEAIARATRTNADRRAFNIGIRSVAHYLPMYIGAHAGWELGGPVGGVAGTIAGERAGALMQRVIQAVRTDPKVGEGLLYAIGGNARPEVYGPYYARMIVNAAHAASKALPVAAETTIQRTAGESQQ